MIKTDIFTIRKIAQTRLAVVLTSFVSERHDHFSFSESLCDARHEVNINRTYYTLCCFVLFTHSIYSTVTQSSVTHRVAYFVCVIPIIYIYIYIAQGDCGQENLFRDDNELSKKYTYLRCFVYIALR